MQGPSMKGRKEEGREYQVSVGLGWPVGLGRHVPSSELLPKGGPRHGVTLQVEQQVNYGAGLASSPDWLLCLWSRNLAMLVPL